MTDKHTLGPWHVGKVVPTRVYSDDGWLVASTIDDYEEPLPEPERYETHKADARLIAAAPEMLEFLKYVRALHEEADLGPIEIRRHALDNLIAKAEGRA